MTPAEAAALLTIAASFDNRKPDADAATAWAMALDGLRFEDCRDGIVAHYRVSREWLMPADVTEGVKRLRHDRRRSHPPIDPPPGLDADDTEAYGRWLAATREAISNGEVIDQAAAHSALSPRPPLALERVFQKMPEPRHDDHRRTPEYRAGRKAAEAELDAVRTTLPGVTAPGDLGHETEAAG